MDLADDINPNPQGIKSINGILADNVCSLMSNTSDNLKAVFHSWASNLVPAPLCANVFQRDDKGKITLIKDHALSPAYSADGKYIAYEYSPDPDHGVLPEIRLYEVATKKEFFIAYSSAGNNKGGWYMPDIQIVNGNVLYHSTISGRLEEYAYSIPDGKISEVRA